MCKFITIFETRGAFLVKIYLIDKSIVTMQFKKFDKENKNRFEFLKIQNYKPIRNKLFHIDVLIFFINKIYFALFD